MRSFKGEFRVGRHGVHNDKWFNGYIFIQLWKRCHKKQKEWVNDDKSLDTSLKTLALEGWG